MRRGLCTWPLALPASCVWQPLAACTDDSTLAPTAPTTGPPLLGVSLVVMAPDPIAHTARSGGATTVYDATDAAFSFMSPNVTIGSEEFNQHEEGDEEFEDAFSNEATSEHQGLGPVFDNVSCEGCHAGDGRGRPPGVGEIAESFLVRISYPGSDEVTGAPSPAPGFGGQLQLRAIAGSTPEASVSITYSEVAGQFADGTTYSLRVPTYEFYDTLRAASRRRCCSARAWLRSTSGSGCSRRFPKPTLLAKEDPNDKNKRRHLGRRESRLGCGAGKTGHWPIRMEGRRAEPHPTNGRRVQRRHGGDVVDVLRRVV